MKPLHLTTLLFVLSLTFSIGCNTKKEDPVTQETSPTEVNAVQKDTTTVAASDNVIQHFVCPNKCKGSGGAAEGKCPVCGTDYVHNDAFHKGTSVPEPAMKIDPVTHMAVPTHTEAKNAQGVYHFVCPKGDPGGAGVAGNCPKCGTPLEHNAAFHNK